MVGIGEGAWWPPVLATAAMAILGVFDHSGVGPTRVLNLYGAPAAVAAVAVVVVIVLWPLRQRAAGPVTAAVAVSLTASLVAIASGLPHAAADGTWLYTETAALLALAAITAWTAPSRWAVPAVLAIALAAALVVARFTPLADGGDGVISAALLWALGVVGASGLGLWLRGSEQSRRRAVREVRRAERLDLARDLHDFVAHHISGIVVQAQFGQRLFDRDPVAAAQALHEIEAAGTQALVSMRRTVSMLRDLDGTSGHGRRHTLDDLPDLVAGFPSATLTMNLGTRPDSIPPQTTTTAYRVVLEALTNVRKHARGATAVEVRVAAEAGLLTVTVTDDAPPRPAPPVRGQRGGFGLIGLTERVTAAGGTLTSGPRSPTGWRVEARLPVKETT
ncbi:sensor histidine kinase [Nonomuraea sp. 10N515B]|uniref:sensor histidine kinase n=1 Tax=Nonomuraea sp. 10N515B TaxID=3457422 RepID=UPI003FCD9035